MAKDHYTSRGLTTPEMMVETLRCRNDFEVAHVERVDIVSILEFKLVRLFPEFRLIIVKDGDMTTDATADPGRHRILVRRSVYRAACNDDPEARMVLAHELGHYLLHYDKNVQMHVDRNGSLQAIKEMTALESTEDQADMFARHFLAPPHLAYHYRDAPAALAAAAGIPLRISRGNVTMSKWPEVYAIRQQFVLTKARRTTSLHRWSEADRPEVALAERLLDVFERDIAPPRSERGLPASPHKEGPGTSL